MMDNIDGGTEIERIRSSITDELREWVVNHRAELNMGQLRPAMIDEIADRIDEQYYRPCRALDSAWSATSHSY